MSYAHHPSSVIEQEIIIRLREQAPIAEQEDKLTEEQLNIIYQQHWFKILAPEKYNGLQLSLPEVVQLEEALSWVDGSLGWVITLCAGAGWFGGFTSPTITEKIFSNPKVCLCGSGAASGTAEKTESGYIVNGKWLHASGAPDATIFTANCIITKNHQPILDNEGNPTILSFLFLKEDVAILPLWNSIGMVATASHGFSTNNLHVPSERTFIISPDKTLVDAPIYKYPFLQLAEATLAANISGVAIHFMDLSESLFKDKKGRNGNPLIEDTTVYETLANNKAMLYNARDEMYQALQKSWQQCEAGTVDNDTLSAVSITSRNLAKLARQAVDELYPYCGLAAANPTTEINRAWRDLHTASQHSLLVFQP